MAEEFQSRDVIRIEILGDEALRVLQELLATVQRLEAQCQQFGVSADAALGKIVAPLTAIQQSSAQTVAELQMLRQELAGLGPAAVGPERAAAGLGMTAQQAAAARMEIEALLARLQSIAAIAPIPIAGYLGAPAAGAAIPMGGYVPGGPPIYVEPTAPIPIAPSPERLLLPERAGPSGLGEDMTRVATESERAALAIEKVGQSTEQARQRTDRYSISWDRHLFWLLRAMVLYQALNFIFGTVSDAIQGMISNLGVYDDAMARTMYITEETRGRIGDMLDTVARLGAAYGQLPSEILPGAVEITRAFKDQEEAIIVSENASKLALMTGMDYAQAIDQIVSIMRLWNMEAEDSGQILDLLAIAYQKSLVNLDDLSRGLAKGAPLAEMLGLELSELTAILATLGEVTVLEPEQAITMMRRLTAAPFRPEIARELQRVYGIEVFVPGTVDQAREVWEILQDVAKIWPELNSQQRASLANLLAGSQVLGGQGPQLKAMLDNWDRINDAMEEYTRLAEEGGQANEMIDEILGALPQKIRVMKAEWDAFLLVAGEASGILEGISGLIDTIRRGIELATDAVMEHKEELSGILDLLAGMPGLGLFFATLGVAPGEEEAETRREPVITYPRREVGRFISEQEILEYQQRQILGLTDAWIRELDVGRNIIDVTELSQEQINAALNESVQMVEALTEAYILAAEAMSGGLLTEEQRASIAEKVKEWYEDQTVILKEQEGVFRVIQGAQAAMLREAIRSIDTMQMGFQRLRDFTPEWMAQIEPLARYYQQLLESMGFYEEPRQILLMGENEQFLLLNIGMTYLRLAIQDLQEAMEEQTGVLRGHFNIPAGYIVPTPWDYYATTGATAVGPVNYPPSVLERYYGYEFPTATAAAATGGATYAGIEQALGPIPAAWATTIPRVPGWDVGDWAEELARAAEMYGLDPRVLAAIMQVESGGAPTAIGAPTQWGRAAGLMQVMPFHEWRLQPGETLMDPWANIRIGAEILAEAIARYGPELGIAAYYGGVEGGALTPGGAEYLRLFEAAFSRLFGAQPEGQEVMTVQGMPEVQRVLNATKTTQDTYLATISLGIQNLIRVNTSILSAVRAQMQPQVTVVMQDTGRAAEEGQRSGYGRGGAAIGHRPEAYY